MQGTSPTEARVPMPDKDHPPASPIASSEIGWNDDISWDGGKTWFTVVDEVDREGDGCRISYVDYDLHMDYLDSLERFEDDDDDFVDVPVRERVCGPGDRLLKMDDPPPAYYEPAPPPAQPCGAAPATNPSGWRCMLPKGHNGPCRLGGAAFGQPPPPEPIARCEGRVKRNKYGRKGAPCKQRAGHKGAHRSI